MNILVTGGNGFVATGLIRYLRAKGHAVRVAVRKMPPVCDVDVVHVGDINGVTDWHAALRGQEGVIHTAARVHMKKSDPLSAYWPTNVQGTLNLSRQAAALGTRRFVFLSSIKVNGEISEARPFSADDIPKPVDPYGISKLEAERGLLSIAAETGMEVVVVRPPIVYGPGVKANFRHLMNLLYFRTPLPLGAIKNLRSMIALENLVDLLELCIHEPAAANQVLLASDGEDISTTELLQRLGRAMGRSAVLFSVPQKLLSIAARTMGMRSVERRLCGNLQLDISKTKKLLHWKPAVSIEHGLRDVAIDYLNTRHGVAGGKRGSDPRPYRT